MQYGMSKKPTSYADVLKQKEQTQQPKKFNLFDFSSVKTQKPAQTPQLNFGQPVSQRNVTNFGDYKQTIPQVQTQPAQKSGFSLITTASAEEKDLIQTFLDDNSVNVENRKTVFEMLKDNVPKNVIEDAIINKAGYKGTQPIQESFIEGVGTKTKESFLGGIKRIGEAGVGLAEGKYNIPEAFARGGAGALQSAFSPVAGVLGETIETGIEKIPQDFKDYISTKTKPTIDDVKIWYDTQTPYQKRQLQNIGVGVELLANFVGAGAVQKATPVVKQGVVKTGEQVFKGGKQVLKPITEPVNTIIKQGKTLLGKPDEIQGIQQAIKPYVKVKDGKVVRSNEQIVNEIKRANELIKQSGDTPTDLLTYRQSIEKQLKGLGEQISTKTKQTLEVDLSETSSKLRELANKKTVGLLDKGESQKLTALADDLEKSGKIGVSEAEYMNQFINDTLRNIPNVSETYKRGLNILVKDLREKLDATLSTIPGEFKQIKKDYGALRNLLGDTVKREIVYNRQNPEGLITGISKMEGLGNIGGGILKILGLDVKGGVSDIGKGLIQNKVGTFIKTKNDPNYIIKQIFSNKGKDVNNVNINIPSTAKSNIGTSKNIGEVKQIKPSILSDREKSLLKPNQPTNVSNKPNIKPKKIGGEVLKKILPSNFKEKTQDLVDKIAEKTGAKTNLLPTNSKQVSNVSDDLIENVGKYTEGFKEGKLFDISPQSKSKISEMEIKADMGEITQKDIDGLNKWFKENKDNYIKLYHGTSPQWNILDEGLKATSSKTAKSLQSGRGYVYLSFDPARAKTFGEMAYAGKTPKVYEVKVRIGDLLADTDQIGNKRYWGENQNIGNTLADSLLYGKGFKVKGNIEPYKISEYQANKPKLLKPSSVSKVEKQVGDDLISEAKKYKSADEFVSSLEKQGKIQYHGTPKQFDKFDLSYMGDTGYTEGPGFYFTDSKDFAKRYTQNTPGGRVVEAYLDIKNPMTLEQRKVNNTQLKNLLNDLLKEDSDILGNYGVDIGYVGKDKAIKEAIDTLNYNDTDVDILSDMGNSLGIDRQKLNDLWIKNTGYDGVITDKIAGRKLEGGEKVIVAFNPSQIKTKEELKQIYEQANKPKLLKKAK